MKVLVTAVATAVIAGAVPALAQAQDNSGTTIYGTLGYGQGDYEGADLGAVQGRIGARFGQYIGVEGEVAAGVKKDDISIAGTRVKTELEHQVGVYGVGYLPVAPNADVFARVGYGNSKIKASLAGASASVDGDSWNYGVGGQVFLDDKNGVRADYTRHDFKDDAGEADTWSLGYVRKF